MISFGQNILNNIKATPDCKYQSFRDL